MKEIRRIVLMLLSIVILLSAAQIENVFAGILSVEDSDSLLSEDTLPPGEEMDRSFLSDLLGSMDLGSLLDGLDVGGLLGGGEEASQLGDLLTLVGIGSRPMKDCTIGKIKDQTYTGKAITPTLTITYNGVRLKKNTDYTVKYSNNTKVGTASCTITGKGNYSGTRKVSFKIVRSGSASQNASGKTTSSGKNSSSKKTGKLTVKLKTGSYVYNGEARKPSVQVTYRGKAVSSADYTLTYKDNKNVGKATVTVKGKEDYKGLSGEASFKITLKKTTLKTASSSASGCITAGWIPDSQADGYQLQFCLEKEFSSGIKKAAVDGGKTASYQMEKLTPGRKWFVRIRSFKKVGSSSWYSDWSGAKQVSVR